MANLKDTTVNGTVTTTSHGTSANWNTAYGWGDHRNGGYASTSAVNAKGNPVPVTRGGEPLGTLTSIDLDLDAGVAYFFYSESEKFAVPLL